MSQTSSRSQDTPLKSSSILAIRLAAASPSNHEESSKNRITQSSESHNCWNSNSVAAQLAQDLLSASNATSIQTEQDTLIALFETVPAAITASRRIHWAIQAQAIALTNNRSDSSDPALHRPTTGLQAFLPTILIDTGRTYSPAAAASLLHANPGQILLTSSATHRLENLPGLPLGPLSDAGLRELLSPSTNLSSAHPLPQQAPQQQSTTPSISAKPISAEIPSALPGDSETRDSNNLFQIKKLIETDTLVNGPSGYRSEELSPSEPVQKTPTTRRLPIIGGIAAASAIVITVVTYFALHNTTTSANVPAATPVPVGTRTTEKPNQPDARSVEKFESARTSNKDQERSKPSDNNAGFTNMPAPEPPSKRSAQTCDLPPTQVQSTFNVAESQYQRGNYKLALLSYSKVLACEPRNIEARRGATRSRNYLDHQATVEP